jgi:hypothetical protein
MAKTNTLDVVHIAPNPGTRFFRYSQILRHKRPEGSHPVLPSSPARTKTDKSNQRITPSHRQNRL